MMTCLENCGFQIIHLITEGIGEDIDGSRNRKIYAEIVRIMRHELGKFQLHEEAWKGPATEIANYILQEKDAVSLFDGGRAIFSPN